METPSVEVLIPHHNRAGDLRLALDSLCEQTTSTRVCVVDNASTDGTVAMLRDELPETRLVSLPRNLGFGAALNRGVEGSDADLVVFLNNDAVADADFVAEIIAARIATGADMIAACLRRPDGAIESLEVEVDRSLGPFDVAYGEPYGDPRHSSLEPLGPSGGAAAFSRRAFEAAGGFDEAFFAYLEDVDLGIRMRMAGAGCALACRAFAWHGHSATLGSGSGEKNRLLGRSRGYLLWKYGANLSRVERLKALAGEATVGGGKALIDRNLGVVRGRFEARRRWPPNRRPAADPRFSVVPRLDLGTLSGLRRRLGRRSPERP